MYETELEVALAAARSAAKYLEREYAAFDLIPDAPAELTTAADLASQNIIIEIIHRHFPEDAFCAEETTAEFAELKGHGARIWVIDPIDGTRGFARKTGEFSIMIGFVDNNNVQVGVVHEPALKRITFARRGGGCWVADETKQTQSQCMVSKISRLEDCTLTQTHSKPNSPPSLGLAALKPGKVIEAYSAGVKMALVARGEADVYVNYYPSFHDWDICAGHLLVEEAGGKATGLAGESLIYGLPGAKQTYGLLATNGLIHEPALMAIAEERSKRGA